MSKSVWSKIYYSTLKLDFLGPGIGLNHKGEGNYQTMIGVIFSIVAYAFSIMCVWDLVEDFIKKKNPSYMLSKSFSDASVKINNENFLSYFKLKKFNFQTKTYAYLPPKEGYLQIQLIELKNNQIIRRQIKDSNGVMRNEINLVPCQSLNSLDTYNSHLLKGFRNRTEEEIQNIKKDSFCIPDLIDLEIFTRDSNSVSFTISTNPNIIEMTNTVESDIFFFEYSFLNIDFELEWEEPYRMVWYTNQKLIKKDSYKRFIINIDENDINVDKTQFVEKQEFNQNVITGSKDVFFDGELNKKQLDPTNTSLQNVELVFKKSLEKYNHSVEFEKFNSLLGEFGGTLDIVSKFFSSLIYFLTNPFLIASELNESILFHSNKLTENGEFIKDFKTHLGQDIDEESSNFSQTLVSPDNNNQDYERININNKASSGIDKNPLKEVEGVIFNFTIGK